MPSNFCIIIQKNQAFSSFFLNCQTSDLYWISGFLRTLLTSLKNFIDLSQLNKSLNTLSKIGRS